jgi:ketosteroid isomerase-like protein
MGQARTVMDQMTAAMVSRDMDAAAKVYASDAVAVTPDLGEIRGRDGIIGYLSQFNVAFPDGEYEPLAAHEAGNVAIDEGFFVGTNTGPLPLPDGELPATGKRMRLRTCDIATVEGGMITSHRFYYDQLEFLEQLGLAPELPS